MDIVAQLKAERDKAAQQVNALDTAIRALSGMSSTRMSHGPHKMSGPRCSSDSQDIHGPISILNRRRRSPYYYAEVGMSRMRA